MSESRVQINFNKFIDNTIECIDIIDKISVYFDRKHEQIDLEILLKAYRNKLNEFIEYVENIILKSHYETQNNDYDSSIRYYVLISIDNEKISNIFETLRKVLVMSYLKNINNNIITKMEDLLNEILDDFVKSSTYNISVAPSSI